jgi:hypothetical protein
MTTVHQWDLEQHLDEVTRLAIYHTMVKLYRLGILETRLDKLLTTMGIEPEIACLYSNQIVPIDVELVKYIESITGSKQQEYTAEHT